MFLEETQLSFHVSSAKRTNKAAFCKEGRIAHSGRAFLSVPPLTRPIKIGSIIQSNRATF